MKVLVLLVRGKGRGEDLRHSESVQMGFLKRGLGFDYRDSS